MKPLFVALIHHPVMDRNGEIITASVTNLDLHDIARSCRTYGVRRYFVVHPSPDEQALNQRIVSHWNTEYGKETHPTRTDALETIRLVNDFDEALKEMEGEAGERPKLVGTSARPNVGTGTTEENTRAHLENHSVCLVFGTGYGLAPIWKERLDAFLPPLLGPTEFNHLSVRSAVAIYLDRLMGVKSEKALPG